MKHITILLAVLSQLMGQPSTEAERLAHNSREYYKLSEASGQLAGEIVMSKGSYFPGEDLEIIVSIQNPTDRTLQVWNPLRIGIGLVEFSRSEPDGSSSGPVNVSMVPRPDLMPIDRSQLATFLPGEKKTATYRSSGSPGFVYAPERPGEYTILYHNRWSAKFVVREAKLDAYVEADLPPERIAPRNLSQAASKLTKIQKAFSVMDSDGYHLCVQLRSTVSDRDDPWFSLARKEGSKLSQMTLFLGGFRCIATSQSRIVDIDMSFARDGSMLVISKREGASMLRHRLDISNQLIP